MYNIVVCLCSGQNVLQIYQTSLKSLDLLSLKQIFGGGVFITNNRNLCFANVTWRNLTAEASQNITVLNNANQILCGTLV
jgi:Receptor L domain